MAIEVRRARADDVEFLAWVMLAASRGHLPLGVWDLLIGADEAGCLEYLRRLAMSEPRWLCHYESFWVADVEGVPAAALCGFEFRAGGWTAVAEAMGQVQRDLGWTEVDVAASQKRVAPVWACFLPDAGADWGIENIAARPEYRRRGMTTTLLDTVVRDGRERGCRLAQITTFLGNQPAQSLYERAGFTPSGEKRCDQFPTILGTEGFVRLLRSL